ncbi:DUF5684 domain-containing protein [Halomarina salina]|uniref:DUF5684 domain-containing protein n=1 Tax=Halomarina salina TaxID=1872699 RepID=A0ABD5RHC9_9EURY|nr:DUF5684 domain-containing protein [Halomarina salina]
MLQSSNLISVPLQSDGAAGAVALVFLLFVLAVLVATIAGRWKAFEKAGHPGWTSLVPIFNLYIMCKIGDNSGWWIAAFLVPLLNIYAVFKINIDVADAFGKGGGFGIGLAFLPFVFWPLLGFGDVSHGTTSRGVHEEWA